MFAEKQQKQQDNRCFRLATNNKLRKLYAFGEFRQAIRVFFYVFGENKQKPKEHVCFL